MEDVLAVYTRPRDPDCPLVCLDETSKQLLAETRVPIPMKPGQNTVFGSGRPCGITFSEQFQEDRQRGVSVIVPPICKVINSNGTSSVSGLSMDYTGKNSAKRSFQRKSDTKAGTNENS